MLTNILSCGKMFMKITLSVVNYSFRRYTPMSSFNEILQKFVNTDYATLVNIAKGAINDLLPVCKAVDPENDGFLMLSSIILSAIGSDGKLTYKEKCFLKDCLGFDDELIDKYIGLYDSKMEALVDKFTDDISTDVGATTLTLVTAIAACDETITREESAFIHKLLS